MNDDLASLFAYNRWSNDRFLEVCRTLTPDQYAAEPLPQMVVDPIDDGPYRDRDRGLAPSGRGRAGRSVSE